MGCWDVAVSKDMAVETWKFHQIFFLIIFLKN